MTDAGVTDGCAADIELGQTGQTTKMSELVIIDVGAEERDAMQVSGLQIGQWTKTVREVEAATSAGKTAPNLR